MTDQPAAVTEPEPIVEDSGDEQSLRAGEGSHADGEQAVAALEARIRTLETAVDELREEVDETRRDGRRVAELYDLVFERLRSPQP